MVSIAELLIENGCPVDTKDHQNTTALAWLITKRHVAEETQLCRVAEVLLGKGADQDAEFVDHADDSKLTVLSYARKHNLRLIATSADNTALNYFLKMGFETLTCSQNETLVKMGIENYQRATPMAFGLTNKWKTLLTCSKLKCSSKAITCKKRGKDKCIDKVKPTSKRIKKTPKKPN